MNQETIPREPLGASTSRRRADTGLSALGALASLAAVLAAASCCVLPLALAALGLGAGLSSNFAALIPLRWPLTATSLIGLAAGWWAYAQRRRSCAGDRSCTMPLPSRATPILLAIGTVLTLIAFAWDLLEAPLMNALS